MNFQTPLPSTDHYLYGKIPAWFALCMTLSLMLFDYIDRQIIVSMFPLIKQDWQLTDAQLGSLVSVISIVVALAAIPVGMVSDRFSRVKCIAAMAILWSLACISCMFSENYTQLFIARSLIGLGEAGYGAAGAVLIASHFPARLRSTLVATLFATSALGSVAGILLGGFFSAQWSWHTAFGLVGFPGLLLGVLFLWVKDYPNANPAPGTDQSPLVASSSIWQGMLSFINTPTVIWVCIGAAAQLVVVSAVWSWLPSYLNRYYQLSTPAAGQLTAAIVLGGAFGCVIWGRIVDKTALHQPNRKLTVMALLCGLSLLLIASAFSFFDFWNDAGLPSRFTLIAIGAFVMTCTIGPASAIIIDVTQAAHRVTGASVLTLFQNLFGLATGPFLVGLLSDWIGLDRALSLISLFSLIAIFSFIKATQYYQHDIQTIHPPH